MRHVFSTCSFGEDLISYQQPTDKPKISHHCPLIMTAYGQVLNKSHSSRQCNISKICDIIFTSIFEAESEIMER